MSKILIVEDDKNIHEILHKTLVKNAYEVIDAYSGRECLNALKYTKINLIILDLMLPDISGEEIIKNCENIPIIVLSAKASEQSKVECLLKGANDYMTKPFSSSELLARIEVQLRAKTKAATTLTYKDLTIDTKTRIAKYKNKEVSLTKTELAILEALLLDPHTVTTKSDLLDIISECSDCDENSLKVHIFNIRKKLKQISTTEYIESVYGIGFKFYD